MRGAGLGVKGDEIWHPPALVSIGFFRKTRKEDTHFSGYLEVSATIIFSQTERITEITAA